MTRKYNILRNVGLQTSQSLELIACRCAQILVGETNWVRNVF